MDAIALQGAEKKGKTDTLNLLSTILLKESYDLILEQNKCGKYSTDNPSDGKYRNGKEDEDFYILLRDNESGLIILISTTGDDKGNIQEAIERALGNGASILITACRTRGQTVDELKSNSNICNVEYIKKTYSVDLSKDSEVNKKDAKNIFKGLEKLINNKK